MVDQAKIALTCEALNKPMGDDSLRLQLDLTSDGTFRGGVFATYKTLSAAKAIMMLAHLKSVVASVEELTLNQYAEGDQRKIDYMKEVVQALIGSIGTYSGAAETRPAARNAAGE